jgi:prenyltransferase beta subunit
MAANSKKITVKKLGYDAEAVEAQFSFIFRLISHWKALVLLDEADVFVQNRSLNHTMNGQVSVFLRKLEYYQGVIFLITNRVRDIDNTV